MIEEELSQLFLALKDSFRATIIVTNKEGKLCVLVESANLLNEGEEVVFSEKIDKINEQAGKK